jgi:hypothetical protein
MANMIYRKVFLFLAAAVSVAVTGCKPPDIHDSSLDVALPAQKKGEAVVPITAVAGLPVKQGQAAAPKFVVRARPDPFALMPDEAAFERSQLAAYLSTTSGSFPMFYEGAPAEEAPPEVEPQPYRRLAGILIGDSVTALIDMGTGQLIEIHPGMIIPGTDWMVVSIDSEKAVLRRVGSTRLPNEVIVRLETAPPGSQNSNPSNNGIGGAPPAAPSGPPGGASS